MMLPTFLSPRSVALTLFGLSLASQATAVSVHFSKSSNSVASSSRFIVNSGIKDQDSNNTFDFQNVNDIEGGDIYTAEIEVAGQTFVVQIDTGSSDLWLDTSKADVSSLTATGIQSGIGYGDGTTAVGPILIGKVTIGNFSVDQAFISAPGSNATSNGDNGLLGVGPPALSAINQTLADTSFNGNPLIENILISDPSLSTLVTFMLSRSESTGTTDGGVFTIGEVDSSYSAITQQPELEVVSSDRWIVFMDGMIVNGQETTGLSTFQITNQQSGQTLANLDTGTSLAQIPQAYADAIYGGIPGAHFSSSQGVYVVPCDANVNVSFVFGGVELPVHPIDVVSATLDDNGAIICFSGFPIADPDDPDQDFLMGDSFLRNVYSLYNYGSSSTSSSSAMSIQLLSTTNKDQAYSEFDSLSKQRNQSLTSGSSGSGSSGSNGGSGQNNAAASISLSNLWPIMTLPLSIVFGLLFV